MGISEKFVLDILQQAQGNPSIIDNRQRQNPLANLAVITLVLIGSIVALMKAREKPKNLREQPCAIADVDFKRL